MRAGDRCVCDGAYVNGVSTRKADRLVEQLGIHGISKDRVSTICLELDERLDAFRNRPLGASFPLSGSTPSISRCAQPATSGARRWSWPTSSTRAATAR